MHKLSLMLLALTFSLVGCGQQTKKIVSNLNVETRDSDHYEKYAHVDFELSIGSAELPNADYELPNGLGVLSLARVDGKNIASVDINLSEALKLPAGQATLPNGTLIPVASSTGVIQIDIPAIKGSVYLSHNGNQTLIGFAMAISVLDRVGEELGGVGLFPSFSVGNVRIIAGIFSHEQSGGTGIAAFADLNGLLSSDKALARGQDGIRFKKYKYSRRLLKKADRVLREIESENIVLEPVLR